MSVHFYLATNVKFKADLRHVNRYLSKYTKTVDITPVNSRGGFDGIEIQDRGSTAHTWGRPGAYRSGPSRIGRTTARAIPFSMPLKTH